MKKHREDEILQYLDANEFLSTEQAMAMFNASAATIRRVFNRLAETYSLRRVQGGVKRLPPDANRSIPFTMREQWLTAEKTRIAQQALTLTQPNSVMFLHSSSTVLTLAKYVSGGTVITDCLHVANLLMQRFLTGGIEVILTGGVFDLKGGGMWGTRAENTIRSYQADLAFISSRGLDSDGILDTNDQIAAMTQAMIDSSRCTVLLADHSKFRQFGMSRVVNWDQIDIIVTSDCPANQEQLAVIKRYGVEIITVPYYPAEL